MVQVCHNDFNFLALTCDRDAIHCAALHKIDPSYVIVSVISVMPFPLTLSELESKECIRVLRNIRVIVKLPDRRPSHNFLKVIRVHREANKKSSREKKHIHKHAAYMNKTQNETKQNCKRGFIVSN